MSYEPVMDGLGWNGNQRFALFRVGSERDFFQLLLGERRFLWDGDGAIDAIHDGTQAGPVDLPQQFVAGGEKVVSGLYQSRAAAWAVLTPSGTPCASTSGADSAAAR